MRAIGLIPAHAGKTQLAQVLGGRFRAHPRACGENEQAASPARLLVGSSPRMRGKRERRRRPGREPGLIPAHAGKTKDTQE